jgi:hypothetical protein
LPHSRRMPSRLFRPSARQSSWLLLIGAVSVGYALYLRYFVVEASTLGPVCDAGANPGLCLVRKSVIALFNHSVFGALALAAAVLNLIRPSILLFGATLATAGFGIVLYNATLSAFAVGLLILSLARPARAAE